MPFVTITVKTGKDATYLNRLSKIIHTAMQETISFPADVYFHKIHELKKENMLYLSEFRNLKRSHDMLFIECTIKSGRSAEKKQLMYERISNDLNTKLGIRKEDIMIVIRENNAEDWYLHPPVQD